MAWGCGAPRAWECRRLGRQQAVSIATSTSAIASRGRRSAHLPLAVAGPGVCHAPGAVLGVAPLRK